jgi:hypothetical protein
VRRCRRRAGARESQASSAFERACAGASGNPSARQTPRGPVPEAHDESIDGDPSLELDDGGPGRLATFLGGGPTTIVPGTALPFEVPDDPLHAVPGLDAAVTLAGQVPTY